MKAGARVLGLDDGPFTFHDASATAPLRATVPVVGVLTRGAHHVEAVLRTDVAVDGDDATDRVLDLVHRSRYATEIRLILVDGLAFGGFNLLDLDRLHAELDLPALAVTTGKPDPDAMERALRRFPDADRRIALLRRQPPTLLPTAGRPLAVRAAGLPPDEIPHVLAATTRHGNTPEPLRLAHMIATAIVKGESRGR